MLLIHYPKCSTCQKAEKWLRSHALPFESRHIAKENPSAGEILDWSARGGLPVRKFFNTSGLLYRSMGLKEKVASLSEEEMAALLATDGMLVKRPILIAGDTVLVGFSEEKWAGALLREEKDA